MWALGEGPVAIGRDLAMVQLVLSPDLPGIGRRHALVSYDAGRRTFRVEGCWSASGTFVDGEGVLQAGQGAEARGPVLPGHAGNRL